MSFVRSSSSTVVLQLAQERAEAAVLRQLRHAQEEVPRVVVLRDRLERLEVTQPQPVHAGGTAEARRFGTGWRAAAPGPRRAPRVARRRRAGRAPRPRRPLASKPVRAFTASLLRLRERGSTRSLCAPSCARRPTGRRAPPLEPTALRARSAAPACGGVVVGHRQHRPRVTLGQLAAADHREHVVGQLEQPDPVRDRGLRAADPLGDLAERQPELVEQHRVARAPPRSATGPRARRSRPGRAGACRGRRSRGRAPAPSRAPPRARRASGARRRSARSRPRPRPHHDRLDQPLRADRLGEPRRSPPASKRRRGWRGFGWICVDRQMCASSGSPPPPISTSKPRPRPRRGRSSGQERSTSSIATFQ